ncbi:hypothetical protein ACFPRL_36290 [Pseudoclavibacter helvolus]
MRAKNVDKPSALSWESLNMPSASRSTVSPWRSVCSAATRFTKTAPEARLFTPAKLTSSSGRMVLHHRSIASLIAAKRLSSTVAAAFCKARSTRRRRTTAA